MTKQGFPDGPGAPSLGKRRRMFVLEARNASQGWLGALWGWLGWKWLGPSWSFGHHSCWCCHYMPMMGRHSEVFGVPGGNSSGLRPVWTVALTSPWSCCPVMFGAVCYFPPSWWVWWFCCLIFPGRHCFHFVVSSGLRPYCPVVVYTPWHFCAVQAGTLSL